jgi:CNT family concentrative nucleoside transporter
MSKIFYPEDQTPVTLGKSGTLHHDREGSLFEAIINGAQSGVKVIVGISALLIAVLGLVALADVILGGIGEKINDFLHISIDWTLKGVLGYIFYPVTLIIGVPPIDAGIIAKIIGERMVVTEVASYQDLAMALETGVLHNPRSAVIATYALCGFAHVASMAIFVGGITALAQKRTAAVSRVAVRALVAATFACLLTACVAGTFFTGGSILLGH